MSHEHLHLTQGAYSWQVKKTLWGVLALNWLVAALKLIFGSLIHSASMVADGFHSFSDGASNIIGLVGMRFAGQPKDQDHPYGHKKYETFAALFIAFLLFFVCFAILHESLGRFRTQRGPEVNLVSLAVLGFTMLVNICVMVYEYNKGKRIGSDILVSDSLHTRADILTSVSVIIAFVGVKMGYLWADAVVALVIAVFIFWSAIGILRNSSRVLCDTAVIDAKEIERVVLAVSGVRKCHHIRTRGRNDDIYIDLHVLMDDQTPLVDAHETSSRIEERIKEGIEGVTDVIVHIEPLSSDGKYED
ncbi:MAG: cation diffusion facilitator family transporter [Candidatus Omnitrophota bacterium]